MTKLIFSAVLFFGAFATFPVFAFDTKTQDKINTAVETDNVELLIEAIGSNHIPKGSAPALHQATNFGAVKIVKYLIKKGANVNALDHDGSTPLTQSAEVTSNRVEILKIFIEAGANINLHDRHDRSAFMAFAGSYGKESETIVQMMLQAGADVKKDGGQAIINAVNRHQSTEIVRMLIAGGANVNKIGKFYSSYAQEGTALMAAVSVYKELSATDEQNIRQLVAAGANLDVVVTSSNLKTTALDNAANNENLRGFALLLSLGAKMNPESSAANVALSKATEQGDLALVKTLLSRGVNPYNARLALHNAAGRGDLEMARLLIAANANVNEHAPYNGSTPLLYALGYNMSEISANNFEMTKLLLSAGANPNETDKNGETAIMTAMLLRDYQHGDVTPQPSRLEAVQALIDAGADLRAANKDGRTALHFAIEAGNRPGILFLQDKLSK